MSFLSHLMPTKIAITSDSIRAEITRAEAEIADHRAKLAGAMDGIAAMSDSEHVAAETRIAATKRAIIRLEAKVVHLNDELPRVISAEEAAAQAASDEALRQRAEASRVANTIGAEKLLTEYDKIASQLADVMAKFEEIADERNAVNAELHKNPVAESVVSYSDVHRKYPNGYYAIPFSEIRVLPPGFAGGSAHWPRQS